MRGIRFLFLFFFLLQGCNAQSRLLEDVKKTVSVENLRYYLYFPEGYDPQIERKFPLLLFLHGGGESGEDLEIVKRNGPPRLLVEGREFPFLILAPQNPHKRKWWNTRAVIQLLEEVVETHHVDPNRIYLTGLSRGATAAWEMAVLFPDRFAAMAVVCGMTPLPYASWIDKTMPIWVFHGREDKSIPFSESEEMVRTLKAMGYDVTFTAYEGVGNNSWQQAYNTEALYEWFMQQER